MIIVTGATGFIGSALVWELNQAGRTDIEIIGVGGNAQNHFGLEGFESLICHATIVTPLYWPFTRGGSTGKINGSNSPG